MHDIDRSFMEFTPEAEYEQEQFEGTEGEWAGESDEVFGEGEIEELASGFLEIANEEELNYFLGDLIGKAAKAVGSAIRSPVGQALGGILKGAAKKALPMVGSAIGGHFGGSQGSKLGGKLGSKAAQLFGLETEGLSHEDEAYEVAKQYVRFAADAVKNATATPAGDPQAAARAAAVKAARRLAPGLLSASPSAQVSPSGGQTPIGARGRTGRWVRRGNRIILYGA